MKDLKAIILETNSTEARESLKKAETLHVVSLGTMGTGGLTMLVALTQFNNDGSIESLDNNNKAGVTAAAGGVILLAGAILSGIGRKKRVQAAEYYNSFLDQTTGSFIQITPASSGLGIGLKWNF